MKKILLILTGIILFGCSQDAPALPTQPKTMLCWTNPTTNTDGTPLTDLAGHIMYCGANTATYPITYDMPVPTQECVTFAEIGLPNGVNFCAVTSYDTSGNESGYSNEVNFILEGGLVPLVGVPNAPSNLQVQ